MAKKKPSTRRASSDPTPGTYTVDQLHLDDSNPRFAGTLGNGKQLAEPDIVASIVGTYGIRDVLSSITTNGFFASEPLVGAINHRHGKDITIVEGNRRLTACLILAGDPRAQSFTDRYSSFLGSEFTEKSKIPVLVYDMSKPEHKKKLLPYLGVRHIVGSQAWDSFAKAAWCAKVTEEGLLTKNEIISTIGDTNRSIDRFLDGYYFVKQIRDEGLYDGRVSNRSGRGSFTDYPFSWVYTALDYPSIRSFVGLQPREEEPEKNPIPEKTKECATDLMVFMFGDSARGKDSVVRDSRELPKLATAVSSRESLLLLRDGTKVLDAIEELRGANERVLDILIQTRKNLRTVSGLLSSTDFEDFEKDEAIKLTAAVEKSANSILSTLKVDK